MAVTPKQTEVASAAAGVALIERLRKGTRNERPVSWPGSEEPVVLVPLNCDELQEAHAAAHLRFEKLKLPINLYTSDDFNAEIHNQVLARALRDPSDETRKTPLFSDADQMRGLIEPQERTDLITEYIALNDLANPDPAQLDAATLAQIDQAVKKKDAQTLSSLGSRMLASFILIMASRQQT